MAISIDWASGVITVPKTDMLLVQSSPIEIRELNLDTFRLALKALEDDAAGMGFPKTHNHNTSVTLSGVQLARVIEILAPYTITFENGSYAVNLVGANSNVADRVNLNNVSIRASNSAGLIQTREIEYASFNGGVTIDVVSGTSGTDYPQGTPAYPVDNLTDAVFIAGLRGFPNLYINNSMALESTDISDYTLIGRSHVNTMITIGSSATCTDITIKNANVTGVLDGGTHIEECVVGNISYVNGHIHNSGLYGTITLDGNEEAVIADCFTIDQDTPPIIDMGGSGQDLAMPNYSGILTINNLTSATEEIGIGLNGGLVTLGDTITAGTIIVSGIGILQDNSVGGTVNTDGLINNTEIARAVWDENTSTHTNDGTFGEELATKADIRASSSTSYIAIGSGSVVYGTEITGSYASSVVRDGTYWQIEEDAVNGITVEGVFNLPNDDHAGVVETYGRYIGTPSTNHYIEMWAYNYDSTSWELLQEEFMPGGMTSDAAYSHEFYERHIDRSNNNEVKIRLIHNTTTYNSNHDLYLDYFTVSSIEFVDAEDIATAVWDKAIPTTPTPGSYGEWVNKKLLTLAKWFGLR